MSAVQNEKKKYISNKISQYHNVDVEKVRSNPDFLVEILGFLADVKVVLDEDLKNPSEDTETNDGLLSVEETAELFKVTPQAVYKWIKQDKIKYEQKTPLGGYLIPKSQFNVVDKDYIKDSQSLILGDAIEIEVAEPSDIYEVYPEKKKS